MLNRAIVCVTNDLSTDQRVYKTCALLCEKNFEVVEYGRLLPESLSLKRDFKIVRKKHIFNSGPLFYAEYNVRLFIFLLFSEVDLIVSNDLDTLPACFLASKLKRAKLIYDTHEYYTETPELVNRKFVQSVWKWIEGCIFPHLKHVVTVNQSIADLYEAKYTKKLLVSRNIPMQIIPDKVLTRKDLNLPENKHIILIQGAGINIHRGAEEMVEAMQYLENEVLLIIGGGDVLPILKEMVMRLQLTEKVIFKPKMPAEALRQYTINSDLGVSIDRNTNINYKFSLPNKLFDYIHAQVPVLASDLFEVARIINRYEVGYFISNFDSKEIADTIQQIFSNIEVYNIKKQNCKKAAAELNWETEKQVFAKLINELH